MNRRAIGLLEEIRNDFKGNSKKVVISGCLGPRGDGYNPGKTMTEKAAETYHGKQVRVFEDSAADMVTAITMNYVEEAVGIAKAAERAAMPAALRAEPLGSTPPEYGDYIRQKINGWGKLVQQFGVKAE